MRLADGYPTFAGAVDLDIRLCLKRRGVRQSERRCRDPDGDGTAVEILERQAGKADREHADLIQLILDVELRIDDRSAESLRIVAVAKFVVSVRLGVEPRLDRSQLLTEFRERLRLQENGLCDLHVRISAVRKDEVAIPSGDGLELLLILRSGKHVLAFYAESHIKGTHAVIGKTVHANTTPFRLAN